MLASMGSPGERIGLAAAALDFRCVMARADEG